MQFRVELPVPAHEMAREEIGKQVAFLSTQIGDVKFSESGDRVYFEAPEPVGESLCREVVVLASRIERALRNVKRKVVFRTTEADHPRFTEETQFDGIHFPGSGQVVLDGIPLQLFRYFDRIFSEFGAQWNIEHVTVPSLIQADILAKCDYFRSFPQYVTFATHLREDAHVINDFRRRHEAADTPDEKALSDMAQPDMCLTPALCYHVYNLWKDRTLPSAGKAYGVCGKCYRFESRNLSEMRRLWEFTLREIVFLGTKEAVLERKTASVEAMAMLLKDHRLAAEIRTASDPFFVAPEAASKTFFQLASESKLEVSLMLPGGERTAVGSHNYHSDFFGKTFQANVAGHGAAHTFCVGFGIERWVYGFLQQHGSNPAHWPQCVRRAPEFVSLPKFASLSELVS
jgi:seryl-tRNA synthetase